MRKDTYQRMRQALQKEQAVWTPQCPEPETLWRWLEQGDAHPRAGFLLHHIFVCAYCREEHLAQLEIRALTGGTGTEGFPLPDEIRALPAKVRIWVQELLQEGITTPVRSALAALNRMERLTAAPVPAALRSNSQVFDMRPASTTLRPMQTVLRWSSRPSGLQYEIQLWRSLTKESKKQIWEGNASSGTEIALPEQVSLEPGGSYFWRVTARTDNYEWYSSRANFTVLSEPMLRQIKELEHKVGNSLLARISIYEAYGLYEEALQSIETLIKSDANDPVAQALKAKLEQRMQLS